MTNRMREGFGVLCVGLICLLIGFVGGASAEEGSTAEGLLAAIGGAGVLFLVIGLALVAWDLLRART